MAIQTIKFDDRQVFVGTPSDIMMAEIASPFAVLLTASDSQEQKEVLGISKKLLNLGCKEFCCIGQNAELLHDHLDLLLEEDGQIDVVTTWHENIIDGCEYFLFGAGGQSLTLYALISDHLELLDALILTAQE